MKPGNMLFVASVWLMLSAQAWSHSLLMAINASADGKTVSVEIGFSTGGAASGVEVRVEDAEGQVLWRGKADPQGRVSFSKPAVDYVVIADSGGGHRVEKEGPK